ncbi:taf4p [Saccharomyces arboricola H-6]|uniref:Transcription initiation factor TFIID subunit 4 n=1 Tax=Saccharomyces arboricola (strain H-6 / AS 2.3317 / CBS 10644) TaxID=1160507 RepID=J8PJY0_SACAR|nr:taf4p [Saccharomyces arboricola H-6]
MPSSPKRPSDGSGEPASSKPKYQTTVPETKPAFNLSSDKASNLSQGFPSATQIVPTTDTSIIRNNPVGRTDDLSLPRNTPPTTNLRIESNTDTKDTLSSPVGLALPKKDDKKKSKGISKTDSKDSAGKLSASSGQGAQQQSDPNKMQDVLFSAGIDVKEEEALLNSSINASKSQVQTNNVRVPKHLPFLHPEQVSNYMKRVGKEQNFSLTFTKNPEILSMMSSACENYMRDILTNAIVISRHRRKAVKINSGRRSEISMALRAIALIQKKEEERRVKKRIALGLEKEDYENKIDSEETLHRASNVTAGLRAGSKKQYGWLTSSVNKPTSLGAKSSGKVASDITARGESGLKFREAREEPGIVMRDLLFALENRRNGVQTIVSKGYAKIRD